jgi:long-subunit acyl-CoA synthetase (AMP-forming)
MTPETILDAFDATVAEHGDETAFLDASTGDPVLTWAETAERVRHVALGLSQYDIGPGTTVAMLLTNRIEFHLVDLATLSLGAVPVSLYSVAAPGQLAFVMKDAQARILITERGLLAKAQATLGGDPQLGDIPVVVVDGEEGDGRTSLADLEADGSADGADDEAIAAGRGGIDRDSIATLIYTSGTTGPPKGVEISHGNVLAAVDAAADITRGELAPGWRVMSYLPMAHIAERAISHYLAVAFAFQIAPVADIRGLGRALVKVRPNVFFGVPRTWEKLKSGIEAKLTEHPAREAIEQAIEASIQAVRLRQAGRPVPEELARGVAAAEEAGFSALRQGVGLDQIRVAVVSAAPSAPSTLEWWHAVGVPIVEVWGMSESTGVGTANRPGEARIGSIGRASHGMEVRLADDGEILLRGPAVFGGYRNLPEKTTEALTEDGWLRTGDIGQVDDDGYFRIVDRKKELIIGSSGKNISPSNIEALLKASPLVGQAVVVGDARPYLSALLTLDPDAAPVFAGKHGLDASNLQSLVTAPQTRAAIQATVDEVNTKISSAERIQKWTLLPAEWQPGGDELTPTMKLRRGPISQRYAAEIDAMYA